MPLPFLVPLALKFAPAILGALGGLFGHKKQGVPDWLMPYINQYQSTIGQYDTAMNDLSATNPFIKALRFEAMPQLKEKFAQRGYGDFSANALQILQSRQAAEAKQSDNQTRMNFAAAGLPSGLLQQVLARQALEREQNAGQQNEQTVDRIGIEARGEYANAEAQRQAAYNQLLAGKTSATANLAQLAASAGFNQAQLPQQPSFLGSLFSGVASAAPGILSSLDKSTAAQPMDEVPRPSTFSMEDLRAPASPIAGTIGTIPGTMPKAFQPPNTITSGALKSQINTPQSYDDWWKYYAGKR